MQKIQGISNCYPELIEGTSKWYYCKDSNISFCDLYEAEEMVKTGHDFECMNFHLIQIYKYTPEYHENVVVRDINTGVIKEEFEGSLRVMPNEIYWRI